MTIKDRSIDAPPFDNKAREYDAILYMSFGGPEGEDDVIPFLKNVTEGRGVPEERLEEVAEHYYHFDGVSPINEQNRKIINALEDELEEHDIDLPIYFGNRNWDPYVEDAIRKMRDDGVERALTFVTSGFSSWSGCRQYREDIINAMEKIDNPPEIDKIRVFYNHPGFISAVVDRTEEAMQELDVTKEDIHLIFTAHSIPMGMAINSDYEEQLDEACKLVADQLGTDNYELVYQSRSGPPHVPWLEPDILDYLKSIQDTGIDHIVINPIGFISDHMEVLYDLDVEAKELADELGINSVRAQTVEDHPKFIGMIRDLIEERLEKDPERIYLGDRGPNHDICAVDCCLKGSKRPSAKRAGKQEVTGE